MEQKVDESLGQLISKRRRQNFLTQEQLAIKMNVSKSAIAKWETDRGFPDRDNLAAISEILGVPIDYLYKVIGGRTENTIFEEGIAEDIVSLLKSRGYQIIKPEK